MWYVQNMCRQHKYLETIKKKKDFVNYVVIEYIKTLTGGGGFTKFMESCLLERLVSKPMTKGK